MSAVDEPPIPLAAPDGRVYAYACSRCHHVAAPGEFLAQLDGPDLGLVEDSRATADNCCRCPHCRKPHDERTWSYCHTCKIIADAELEARLIPVREQDAKRKAHNDTALAASPDRESALSLVALMSDISEECWCAGWMIGLEQSLWSVVCSGERTYGMGMISLTDLERLRRLSMRCNGWWRWDEELGGEVFTPMKEWVRIYDEASSG